VIGGMGSISGAIVTGLVLGVVEGLTKVFFPEASNIVVFVIMAIVLVFKPNGLFGKDIVVVAANHEGDDATDASTSVIWPWVALVIVAALLVAAPFFLYPTFVMKMLCFALFACAFNLLLGYGGLLSFGHAMFFGWAGYICAHAVKVWGLTPELGILAGAAAAALLGLVSGALAIRSKGIYFAMVTLALAQMMYFIALQAPLTGGEDGIQGVPRGALFGLIPLGNEITMYYFVCTIFVLGVFCVYRTINSPFGEVLRSIRDNEQRAISLGYSVNRYKLVAFVLSAALAGVAGATKVLVFQLASLTDVHWTMSGEVVLMTMLGGMGTIFGPAVGASIVVGLQNFFATAGEWVTIIQGAIFILCVLMFRRGVIGEALRLFVRKRAG
jgi:branched-chain amino acid transport system permease protein